MKSINHKVSGKMRLLRNKNNLTQLHLSELSGIEYKHIQKLESKDPGNIKLITVEKLAKAFKMSLSEFLDF